MMVLLEYGPFYNTLFSFRAGQRPALALRVAPDLRQALARSEAKDFGYTGRSQPTTLST
ncbi:hypothetical protein RE428_05190 [Marinobacter nanhaiticus D15-8W]|nr:hypothetical protein RE428_05190 [Marinobacter nanhaiticus D15-8W]